MGEIYFAYNKVIISQSSQEIIFYKLEKTDADVFPEWKEYFKLQIKGLIHYIKGNSNFQIITDEKIMFFNIDKKTLMPQIRSVMNNYMECSYLMFGRGTGKDGVQNFCICYKSDSINFDIYQRRYQHNFKTPVAKGDFEGSKSLELQNLGAFLVTKQK